MKRLFLLLGLFTLLTPPLAAQAAPTSPGKQYANAMQPVQSATKASWRQLGRAQGALIRLNPFLPKQRTATMLMQLASYQSGRALRAYMVGLMPAGLAREAHASYLEGLAEGMR